MRESAGKTVEVYVERKTVNEFQQTPVALDENFSPEEKAEQYKTEEKKLKRKKYSKNQNLRDDRQKELKMQYLRNLREARLEEIHAEFSAIG